MNCIVLLLNYFDFIRVFKIQYINYNLGPLLVLKRTVEKQTFILKELRVPFSLLRKEFKIMCWLPLGFSFLRNHKGTFCSIRYKKDLLCLTVYGVRGLRIGRG